MNKTATTVTITLIIVSAAMLSGCLTDTDQNSHDETIDRMAKLEAILTDPNISDEEKIAAHVAEMEAITGEKYNLHTQANETPIPTPESKNYQVAVGIKQGSVDITKGTGELIVTINGGKDFYALEEMRVLVNNETIDVYPAECKVPRTIGCNIIGDWKVTIEGTFEDGTVQTLLNTRFNGIPNLKTSTSIAPERYVKPSGLSREDAKRIAEENGVVWGCDDTPTPTPTFPKATPTPDVTPTLPRYYNIYAIVDRTQWNENTIAFLLVNGLSGPSGCHHDTLDNLDHVVIYVDGRSVAAFKPTIVKGNTRLEISECPMIINLPDGITNHGEITMIGSFSDMALDTPDGDYPITVDARTPPEEYQAEYAAYPVWNP